LRRIAIIGGGKQKKKSNVDGKAYFQIKS